MDFEVPATIQDTQDSTSSTPLYKDPLHLTEE